MTAMAPSRAKMRTTSAFAVTLHVVDVEHSVNFYRILFNQNPSRHFHEYADFLVSDPPLVLGLMHVNAYPGRPTNRLGIPFADAIALGEAVSRLEMAGHKVESGEVEDPDHNMLELFHRNAPDTVPVMPVLDATSVVGTWQHKLCSLPPETIPHETNSLDEVTLQGSFNARVEPGRLSSFLSEVFRVLKPRGKVLVTGLVGDGHVDSPSLPGMASRFEVIPQEMEPMHALTAAGFVDLYFELFGDIICFQIPGIDLRKIRLFGTKPVTWESNSAEVCYQGPLASVRSDSGKLYPRGEWIAATASEARKLDGARFRSRNS